MTQVANAEARLNQVERKLAEHESGSGVAAAIARRDISSYKSESTIAKDRFSAAVFGCRKNRLLGSSPNYRDEGCLAGSLGAVGGFV